MKHLVNLPEYMIGGGSAIILVAAVGFGIPLGFLTEAASFGLIGSGTSIAVTDSFFPSKKE